MSFIIVRNNARSRFHENALFLNYITSLEPRLITDPVNVEVKIMRGLFYVQLYASLEKTVNEIIENTLIHIGTKSVQFKHYTSPFYSISLVDKLKSFKDSGHSNFFKKAFEVFSESSSSNVPSLNESVFANNLQNIWTNTVIEVCNSFGIKELSITPRVRATIDEIVDKRNAVAHGRESAVVIGERHRTDVLRTKMEIIITFCDHLIDAFEDYFNRKNYLKPTAKRYYL